MTEKVTDLDRLEWLLEFSQRDLASLRHGDLIELRDDVHAFAKRIPFGDAEALARFKDDYRPVALGGDPGDVLVLHGFLVRYQEPVRRGMEQLHSNEEPLGGFWQPFGSKDFPAPDWRLYRLTDGTLRRDYGGSLPTKFLASAVDLLVLWWPQLRRCEHAACCAFFLPDHGRQKYHAPACRQAAFRSRKLQPKRDYAAEHVAHVKRNVSSGAAKKIRQDQAKKQKTTKKPTPRKSTQKGKSR